MQTATRFAFRRGGWLIALSVTLSMIGLLAGCGGGTSAPNQAPKVAPGATRTIVDMAGRHVQIPITVTRVATNIPLIPPTIYLLGGISKLVAATTTPATPLFTT
ncbi:MAG: hypothetical protein ACRDSH_21220, partial [Pseudonocardiaceae bacterium]